LETFSSYDLILVDTAGRNFREDTYIEEMKRNIQLKDNVATYLVLSLTAKPKDLLDIQEQFQTIQVHAIIFTKLDETTQYGSILSIITEMDKPIAYITNGQDVPDDLIKPSTEKIVDLITGDFYNA